MTTLQSPQPSGRRPICDGEEAAVRMYPALDMEESVLREGLEITEAGIGNVCEHWHPKGECPTVPMGDFGV